MEIYNERMERIEHPDLTKGYLVAGMRMVHHSAIAGTEERWHYETIAEYENGGRDVRRVIDVPGVEAREAWDEEIAIQIYRPYTQEEQEAMKQAAAQPTMEERMARMEQQLTALSKRIEAALERTMNIKGGETDGENHADAQQL